MSAAVPGLVFAVPETFHPVPTPSPDETYEEFSDRVLDFTGQSCGTGEDLDDVRKVVAALHAANAAELWETGVIHQAIGVVPVPEGEQDEVRLSRCTLLT